VKGKINMENLGYLLYLLACPVGMGLMMWMMMRGNKDQAHGANEVSPENAAINGMAASTSPDDLIARLRAQLDELEAQQAAIAAEMSQLSDQDAQAESDGTTLASVGEPASLPVRQSV
jgi:UDP-N-acetylglucosamine:LPS N-acetylglucosamine transferase